MPHPFPGMNPWLENPNLWHNVHQSLIVALRDELAPRLRPRYFVAIETHTWVAVFPDATPAIRYPDVAIINRGGSAVTTPNVESTPYLEVTLPFPEPIEESYLEVRVVPTGEVVTVIELLSHTNKQSDRLEYIKKRDQLLRASVNFVEIDLLRAGEPMPYTEKAQNSAHRLFIYRNAPPYKARLYPFSLRQPIPTFPLPLRPDDNEPLVDLGALLQGLYDRAGYDMVINYQQPPTPPLSEDDAAWAAEQFSRTG